MSDPGRAWEMEEELATARTLLENSREQAVYDEDTLTMLIEFGGYCMTAARYDDAEKFYQGALDIYRYDNPEEDVFVGITLNCMASALLFSGEFERAAPLLHKAQAIFEVDPPSPERRASCLGHLGGLYQQQNRPEEAEAALLKALALCQDELPVGHSATIHIRNGLACFYFNQRQPQKAGPLLRENAALFRAGDTTDSFEENFDLLRHITNFATWHGAQGSVAEAEALLDEAMEIARKILPEDHPSIAEILMAHATALISQERFAEMDVLLTEALRINRDKLPWNHPQMATNLSNLGFVRLTQGRLMEARDYVIQALAICETTFPAGHSEITRHKAILALCYERLGAWDEAIEYYREARQNAAPPDSILIGQKLMLLTVRRRLRKIQDFLTNPFRRPEGMALPESRQE